MENIINTNYKKKYLKYKNKYHKLIKNNKLKGGGIESMSIIAIILTLITIFGVGTGVAIKNDWINSVLDSYNKNAVSTPPVSSSTTTPPVSSAPVSSAPVSSAPVSSTTPVSTTVLPVKVAAPPATPVVLAENTEIDSINAMVLAMNPKDLKNFWFNTHQDEQKSMLEVMSSEAKAVVSKVYLEDRKEKSQEIENDLYKIFEEYKDNSITTSNVNLLATKLQFDNKMQSVDEFLNKLNELELPFFNLFGIYVDTTLWCKKDDETGPYSSKQLLVPTVLIDLPAEDTYEKIFNKIKVTEPPPPEGGEVWAFDPNCIPTNLARQSTKYSSVADRDYFISYVKNVIPEKDSNYSEENATKIEINIQLDNFNLYDKNYVPIGIIIHNGNSQGGHYYTYIKKQNNWYKCDDALAEETTWDYIKTQYKNAFLICWAKDTVVLNEQEPFGIERCGNTCYINSFLQILFNIPQFEEKYNEYKKI